MYLLLWWRKNWTCCFPLSSSLLTDVVFFFFWKIGEHCTKAKRARESEHAPPPPPAFEVNKNHAVIIFRRVRSTISKENIEGLRIDTQIPPSSISAHIFRVSLIGTVNSRVTPLLQGSPTLWIKGAFYLSELTGQDIPVVMRILLLTKAIQTD